MMTQICKLLIFIAETVASYFYCDHKFQRKRSGPWIFLFTGAAALSLYFIESLKIPVLNAASFMLLLFVFLRCCYDADLKACIFSIALLTAVMIASEMTVMYLSSLIFGVALDMCLTSDFIFNTQAAIAKLLYFLCVYCLSRHTVREPGGVKLRAPVFLGILPVTSALFMHTTIYICIYSDPDSRFKALLTLCNILALFSNIIVFYIYEHTLKTDRKYTELLLCRKQERSRSEYYRLLQEQNNNTRILLHDITKHLNTLMMLEQNADVRDYITQLTDDFRIGHPIDYCGNTMLNIIIYRYSAICRSKGINFQTGVQDAKLDFMSEPDITALFDNILENAVEAAACSDEKTVDLSAGIRNANFLVIRATNSCAGKPSITGQNAVTTKKDPGLHGIGVKSIKRVVQKYDGNLDMTYQDEQKTFSVTITFQLTRASSPH